MEYLYAYLAGLVIATTSVGTHYAMKSEDHEDAIFLALIVGVFWPIAFLPWAVVKTTAALRPRLEHQREMRALRDREERLQLKEHLDEVERSLKNESADYID